MDPKVDIYSIPAEIWAEIFSLACLDNGKTSLALSQVSRAIRSLSENQRYLTIKINSTSQLFKLQDVLTAKGKLDADSGSRQQHPLRARFLCIILPQGTMEQAYPEESYVPEDDPEDEPWTGCRLSMEDGPDGGMCMRRRASSESGSEPDVFDSDDAEFEYKSDSDEDGEMDAEIADLQNDMSSFEKGSAAGLKLTIGDLSEMGDVHTASSQLEYRIYSAIRRLLEACSASLEAFTLWIYPKCLIPLEILVPPLPKLTSLSIGVHSAIWTLARRAGEGPPAPLFPALCRLRLLAKHAPPRSTAWWKDVLKLTIRGKSMNLVTSLPKLLLKGIPSTRCDWDFCDDMGDTHCPGSFEADVYPARMLRDLMAEWWREDVAGGRSYSCPPTPPVRVRVLE